MIAAALIMLISVGALADSHSPIKDYMNNRSPESFIEAFREYETAVADSQDMSAVIYLAYMHKMEINDKLKTLEGNLDNLKNKQKFQYANLLLGLNRFEESVTIYDRLNEEVPKWSCPWRHKGEAYWKMGKLEKAIDALEMAIETRETHYDAYVMLADVLNDKGEYKRALKVLEKGFTYYGKDIEDPEEEVDSVDVNFLYLELLKKNGKEEEYQKQLERMRKMAPEDERLEECEAM